MRSTGILGTSAIIKLESNIVCLFKPSGGQSGLKLFGVKTMADERRMDRGIIRFYKLITYNIPPLIVYLLVEKERGEKGKKKIPQHIKIWACSNGEKGKRARMLAFLNVGGGQGCDFQRTASR